ncbi:MAG: RluA family pseudouridine synthase [Candidatus Omnitrophota bacterium]
MKEFVLKSSSEDSGMRLDMFLLRYSNKESLGLSRTLIQKLIREGKIRISGPGSLKPNRKIKENEEIMITLEEKAANGLIAESMPLDIVYEDNDVAVINKPAGLVVHPGAGNHEHTLVNALLFHLKELSDINPKRPGIVHRLDKETSGLLVVAKNNPSHLALARQFAKHTIKRKYIAVVRGKVEFDEDVIELPIARHAVKRKSMAVSFAKDSKYSKTHYRTLRRGDDYSALELTPYTGRTHQLRVHLSFLGHPILGDTKYSSNNAFTRLMLHAQALGFIHPQTGKFLEFSSKIPPEFSPFLAKK